MGMEKKLLLWIWYYHELPTAYQLRAESNLVVYNKLYEKYKDSYKDYFNINPNDLNPSETLCEYVILYYERRMRNVNTSL